MVNLRRSLVINFFSSSGATIAQFIVSILLARMLSPGEIGVFSMTIVLVNIVHIFRDFGVGTYLQREPDLTPEKMRAATGVMYTTSWIIAAGLYLSSPWISQWFKEPAMVPVMKVLAVGFIFIPFGSITHSLLTREFAAGKQAIVNVVGTGAFTVTCLTLAYLGFGTMSMAWANLANIIACAIAYTPLRPKNLPWLPSFRKWRNVLHFGIGTLLSNCIGAINNAVPDILLGKLGNATMVGLFSRASSTVSIFTYIAGSTVNYGSVSYISQAYHRREPLGPLLNRVTALVTGVGWPALALTYVFSAEIVTALYGEKWLPAVPAIDALVIAGMISLIFNYTPTALTAIGRPYLSATPLIATLLTRIAFGVVLFNGDIRNFSWAICAATVLAAPVMIYQHYVYLSHRFGTMLTALMPSALVAIACMAAAMLFKMMLPTSLHAMAVLLILTLPLASVWYLALRLTRHPLMAELHLVANGLKARLA
ncbi:oligosaccharide flippase family protein [Noviherbaspirillum suwonense]|uniref:Membrane protein involved in the export of O-antigen and teichoic acid n=1 Tax=Noviherbaspirillum suwonense TaxID=1224511 RepID=A0ABY1QFJ0_9BURK|nr:oligosaccharide flippase family protein [Noviherbaspirillum suwonense]SMP69460.1 Membrane protein involved in the export of O-antigen and teichoic acid [Noviherbaspirillum suwonense]